jgi:DNA-binding HxlR family transcriptional regulator
VIVTNYIAGDGMYTCPVFGVADIIGKKWAIVVVQEVKLNGEKGFNAIHQRMAKLSPKILSTRLKDLEKEGIINRTVKTDKMPLRTSYSLTTKGQELNMIITELRRWQVKYNPKIMGCERRECVKCPLY